MTAPGTELSLYREYYTKFKCNPGGNKNNYSNNKIVKEIGPFVKKCMDIN